MPRLLVCLRPLAALALVASPLAAQVVSAARGAGEDSAHRALSMDFGLSMIRPADYVLSRRAELALSAAQVKRLETLSKALEESTTVREARLMKAMGAVERSQVSEYVTLLGGWTGSIDEARLRRDACESAAAGLDPLLGLARDRRVVGAVLTADQLSRLSKLEQSGERGMMRDIEQPAASAPAGSSPAHRPYFEFQVEQPATLVPGTPGPPFPPELRGVVARGEVLAQFVVDTSGRADLKSFKVLRSSHDLFTESVRYALPTMQFTPGTIGGRPVPQLVQMPFEFTAPRER